MIKKVSGEISQDYFWREICEKCIGSGDARSAGCLEF